jgi:hypothetical protein
MRDRPDVDQIAAEVYQLLQTVSDDCENPQVMVLELAQRVEDRRHGGTKITTAAGRACTPASERLIQNVFSKLDPRAQEIMRLQLAEGSHYRAIATRLNMQPADALRILTDAYVQLRWHTEESELTTKSMPP